MKRILLVALVLLLVVSTTSTVFAEEQTVTINMKVTVAFVGKTAMGTLVIRNECPGLQTPCKWSFIGQVDGQPASASGLITLKWTGAGYEGTVTQIDSWDMGGVGRPKLPLTGALVQDVNQVFWGVVNTHRRGTFSIPLAIPAIKKLPEPCTGNIVFDVTNVAGVQEITGLPKTGSGPDWLNPVIVVLAVLGVAAIGGSRVILRRTT